jgi:ribosomal-protein-alanine N-acetyltransferase
VVCQKLVDGTITAIDRSATMVARARGRNHAHIATGRARIEQQTLADADFRRGSMATSFTKVFAINVNAFWTQPAPSFAAARRALRTDGTLFLVYEPPSADRLRSLRRQLRLLLPEHGFRVGDERVRALGMRRGICVIAHPALPSLPPQHTLPSLGTPRLLLRLMAPSDAADVFAYAKDPEVLRYTTGTTPRRLEETRAFLQGALSDPNGRVWAIRLRDQPTVIGGVDFGLSSPETGSVHYVLARPHWSQGLMTEAVDAVCSWAFATLPSLVDIQTTVVDENVASVRVLEKCGFTRVGTTVEQWQKQAEPVRLAIFRRSRDG